MYLSLYSELEPTGTNPDPTNDPTFFFSTKISSPNPDLQVTFLDLINEIYKQLQLEPPDNLKNKVYYFELFQIKYWAQANDRQFFHTIEIPSGSTLKQGPSGQEFPILAKKDGTYKVHFYAKHKHIGNLSLIPVQ